ncbi:unnamed protein product [Heligmosomoides polygyrus]|uniref:Transposase n=1 Tax=Heligmosomoides polygyrus TaxID=6339 RepID=A0A183FYL6_HELPZ|nr:unnamed protein product [Heligmosomoides polygyrus]
MKPIAIGPNQALTSAHAIRAVVIGARFRHPVGVGPQHALFERRTKLGKGLQYVVQKFRTEGEPNPGLPRMQYASIHRSTIRLPCVSTRAYKTLIEHARGGDTIRNATAAATRYNIPGW